MSTDPNSLLSTGCYSGTEYKKNDRKRLESTRGLFAHIFEGVPRWAVFQGPSPHRLELPHHLHSEAYIAVAPLLQIGRESSHDQLRYLPTPIRGLLQSCGRSTLQRMGGEQERCDRDTDCNRFWVPLSPPNIYTSVAAASAKAGKASNLVHPHPPIDPPDHLALDDKRAATRFRDVHLSPTHAGLTCTFLDGTPLDINTAASCGTKNSTSLSFHLSISSSNAVRYLASCLGGNRGPCDDSKTGLGGFQGGA